MALPIINRIWSESPYLMNGNEHVASNYYESVHESQIGIAIFDILHLDVRDSAGSVLSTEGRECINTTRLIVTGGKSRLSVKVPNISFIQDLLFIFAVCCSTVAIRRLMYFDIRNG